MDFQSVIFFGWIDLTHPVMLLFGIGALIPLLIHYWHRHNHVRMNWAATHYLKLTLKKVGRRFSILQWLLLALRIMILLVLAASLAAPAIRNLSSMFGSPGNSPTLHVILVDRTMSMQAKSQDRSRFEEAKRIASGIVESSNDLDGIALFYFDQQLDAGLPLPVSDPNVVKSSIDGARATLKSARLAEILEDLKLRMQRPEFQEFERTRLHVISDFSFRDWFDKKRENNATEKTRLINAWDAISDSVDQTQLHSVASGSQSNNFISELSAGQSVFLVGQSGSIQVVAQNRGAESSQNLAIELLVNEQVITSKQVRLEPDSRAMATFDLAFDRPGNQFVEARITGDGLDADNHRYLTVQCRSQYQVLFVEGRPGGSRFVQIALAPDPIENSSYRFQTCLPADLARLDLASYDVIVWDNLPRQNLVEINRLKGFVKRGGQMIMFLGDLIDRPQFNSMWNGAGNDSFDLQLTELKPIDNYQLDPLEYRSQFLEAFRGNPQAGLADLPVWVYFKLKLKNKSADSGSAGNLTSNQDSKTDSPTWNVDLALTNGDPLLVSRRYARGAIVLFASSSSSDSRLRDGTEGPEGTPWNANETVPAFPALVQEIFANLNRLPKTTETRIGEMWIGNIDFRSRLLASTLTGPDGDLVDTNVNQSNDRLEWRSEQLDDAGFYRFLSKAADTEITIPLAVNVDPYESDLRVSPFAESDQVLEAGGTSSMNPLRPSSLQIYQWALGVVVAMLLLESVAALRFGRSRG